jgi:hypothetical protein
MDDHDDFAFEPIPGLPEKLPAGEALLWQGSPDWRALAISAFHVRKVAVYFLLLFAWQMATAKGAELTAAGIATAAAKNGGLAVVTTGILALLAYAYARGTIYTLSDRRLVIRSGLALPVTLNLPLALIDSAAAIRQPFSTESIALTVARPNRVAWLVLWPSARPWHFNNPQPMLRCLKDAAIVAPLLARALEAATATVSPSRAPVRVPVQPAASGVMPGGATIAA